MGGCASKPQIKGDEKIEKTPSQANGSGREVPASIQSESEKSNSMKNEAPVNLAQKIFSENPDFLPGSPPASGEWAEDEPVDLSVITRRSAMDVENKPATAAESIFNDPKIAAEIAARNHEAALFAKMAGSMHNNVLALGGGGTSIHSGVAAMRSASMHAGVLLTGSMHGGSGRSSSLALRALQAAKVRESKTPLERHNVQIIGSGQELLVFSHAFGSNQNMWSDILESFDTARYRVVLYDLIGAFGTDYDAFDFQRYSTLHGFAEDLLQLLKELGVEGSEWGQQCTFVGYRQSGMIGLLASVEKPRVFQRIIILGSSPRLLSAPGYEGSFAINDLDQVFGIMQGNFKMWSSGCTPVLTADDVKASHVREFTRSLFALRADVGFSNLKTVFACDVRDVLPKVQVQVHMLFIAEDTTVPGSTVQYMLNSIPNAFAEVLPVESLQMRPEIVAAGIMRHLEMPLREIGSTGGRRTKSMRFAPMPLEETDTLHEEDSMEIEII